MGKMVLAFGPVDKSLSLHLPSLKPKAPGAGAGGEGSRGGQVVGHRADGKPVYNSEYKQGQQIKWNYGTGETYTGHVTGSYDDPKHWGKGVHAVVTHRDGEPFTAHAQVPFAHIFGHPGGMYDSEGKMQKAMLVFGATLEAVEQFVVKAAGGGGGGLGPAAVQQNYFKGTNPKSGKAMMDYSALRDVPMQNYGRLIDDYSQGHFKTKAGHDAHIYNLSHGNFVSVTHEPGDDKDGKAKTKVRMHVHRGNDKAMETHDLMTSPDGHDEHDSHKYAEHLQGLHKKALSQLTSQVSPGGPAHAAMSELAGHTAAAIAHGENDCAHTLWHPDKADSKKKSSDGLAESLAAANAVGQKLTPAFNLGLGSTGLGMNAGGNGGAEGGGGDGGGGNEAAPSKGDK